MLKQLHRPPAADGSSKHNQPIEKRRKETMKRTIIGLSATVALAAIVLTQGALHTTRAQGQQGAQGNQGNQSSVVGSWTVTVYVNTPGGPVPFATEFASFNPGGTFSDAFNLAF